jgi:multiple sugar transport system permease protein
MILPFGRRRAARNASSGTHALIGPDEWRRPWVKWGLGGAQVLLLVGLIVVGLGPLLWLAKSAITPTNDTITYPMAFFPHGAAWSNLHEAWVNVQVGKYFWNTVVLAIGSWFVQVFVATTAGYAHSVLSPK